MGKLVLTLRTMKPKRITDLSFLRGLLRRRTRDGHELTTVSRLSTLNVYKQGLATFFVSNNKFCKNKGNQIYEDSYQPAPYAYPLYRPRR